jgi:hypothetical protein
MLYKGVKHIYLSKQYGFLKVNSFNNKPYTLKNIELLMYH